MNKQKSLARSATAKGFTIVELIVIIAIIAVLAGIIVSSVTAYIRSSKVSAIKANLSTLATKATVYFESNLNDFGYNFVNNPIFGCGGIGKIINSPVTQAIYKAGGETMCFGSGTGGVQDWCAKAKMPGNEDFGSSDVFCVDSTGAKASLGDLSDDHDVRLQICNENVSNFCRVP